MNEDISVNLSTKKEPEVIIESGEDSRRRSYVSASSHSESGSFKFKQAEVAKVSLGFASLN